MKYNIDRNICSILENYSYVCCEMPTLHAMNTGIYRYVKGLEYNLILTHFSLETAKKGNWQTVQTQIRRRNMRRMISISTL